MSSNSNHNEKLLLNLDEPRGGQPSTEELSQQQLPPLPDTPPRICADSNIIASLSDGVLLSYNAVPPQMEISNSTKVNEILSELTKEFSESVSQPVVVAPPKSPKGKKGKRDDEQKQQSVAGGVEQGRKEASNEAKMSERRAEIERILTTRESTKNIYVSTPNGIRLSFKYGVLVHDYEQHENNARTFLVKQERVMNEKEEVTLENCDRVTEMYRCITSDGLVIKVKIYTIQKKGFFSHSRIHTHWLIFVMDTV